MDGQDGSARERLPRRVLRNAWTTRRRFTTIRRFVQSVSPECLRVLDINLRAPFDDDDAIRESLPLANVLKLNDEELPRVAGLLGISGTEQELVAALIERYSYQLVALTRGAGGALVVSRAGETSELPAESVRISDTVGAGDAYTACLVLGLLAGWELKKLNSAAINVAGYVCSRREPPWKCRSTCAICFETLDGFRDDTPPVLHLARGHGFVSENIVR